MTDNELILFEENGLYGLKDAEGKVVRPACYQDVYCFDDYGVMLVVKDGKYGLIDERGKEIHPCDFDAVWDSGCGFHIAVKGGKQNILDGMGKLQLAGWYDHIHPLKDGVFLLVNGKKVLCIEKLGDVPMECPTDAKGVYSPDGKVMYMPKVPNEYTAYSSPDTICTSPSTTVDN